MLLFGESLENAIFVFEGESNSKFEEDEFFEGERFEYADESIEDCFVGVEDEEDFEGEEEDGGVFFL